MRFAPNHAFALIAAGIVAVGAPGVASAADEDAARAQRWSELKQDVFGDKTIGETKDVVSLDAPKRAEDAAIVPITLKSAKPDEVKAMTLVIDENPSPVAARMTFGEAGDASQTSLRVRVNSYTNMHLVGETKDGKLLQTAAFVKASGGCSAPAGVSDDEALAGAGEMRLKMAGEGRARLMIRHPNFTGMQMNVETRAYTPARYIKEYRVTLNDKEVFTLAGDISISANPVIEFGFKPADKGVFKVVATDTDNEKWEKTFDANGATN